MRIDREDLSAQGCCKADLATLLLPRASNAMTLRFMPMQVYELDHGESMQFCKGKLEITGTIGARLCQRRTSLLFLYIVAARVPVLAADLAHALAVAVLTCL